MLLFKTAFKNIIGSGKRTWLNVSVLALIIILMVAYMAVLDGWTEEARRDTREWETGAGQLWHPEYDRFDVFTLQDAHGVIPEKLSDCINSNSATPVLVLQASIFPQGRMQNILLKGIPANQQVLKLPAHELKTETDGAIPVMIGSRMARSADLKTGDRVLMRWRDKNGVFDAREIKVSHIFYSKAPAVDGGQIWIDIDVLYEMSGMTGEATFFVQTADCPITSDISGWQFKEEKFLMADLELMAQSSKIESAIIFAVLLSIALLAIFDTQVLSIFRRQKEIGTYVALGMTPRKVIGLFTIEGTMYSILATALSAVVGTPFFIWFAGVGLPLPDTFEDMNIVMGEAMLPAYNFSTILTVVAVTVIFSAFISYLPARKIARQNMVLALKGKIN